VIVSGHQNQITQMQTLEAPKFTAQTSQPANHPPVADGVEISNWYSVGMNQEERRKIVRTTKFIDYRGHQWWTQDRELFYQKREVGDLRDILVESNIWSRKGSGGTQGLGIKSI